MNLKSTIIKISIIVPVYNASLYLEKCIRSILAQTLQEIEVIIVNDGSTDDSLTIMKGFEKEDNRIIVIDSVNSGVSAARNKGLEIARGEWIGFADADDWMEQGMLETLYDEAGKSAAGMAVCNVALVTDRYPSLKRLKLKEGVFNFESQPEKAVEEMMDFRFDYGNWNKIYHAQIIRKNKLRFNEPIRIGEDLLFNLYYLHFIESIVVVDQPLYQYRVHQTSVMANSEHTRIEQYNLQFEAYKTFANTYGLLKEWEMFRKLMARGCYYTLIPRLINSIKRTSPGYFHLVAKLSAELGKLKDEIYYFPRDTRTGLQGLKKNLLMHKKFRLFAIVAGLRHA